MKVRSHSLANFTAPDLTAARVSPHDPGQVLLQNACAVLRMRRRQRLTLGSDGAEMFCLVRSGLLLLAVSASVKRRTILSILFPGDIFRTACAPPLPGIALMAATTTEVARLPWRTVEDLTSSNPLIRDFVARASAALLARQMLHGAIVGALSGEERAASFLVDVALRTGYTSARSVVFEMSMNRPDIADYLALNADTLSRIMSSFRARGVFASADNRRAIVSDWNRLCTLTPIAGALQELARRTRPQLPCDKA